MQRITQYDGLYGEANARPGGEYIFSELLETRSPAFNWVIQPHIHARLFQIFFVETGQVAFQESTGRRDLIAPFMVLTPPTALHGLTYSPDATGRILTLSNSLVESLFPHTSALALMLGTMQYVTSFSEPYFADRVRSMMMEVDEELYDNQPEKRLMLQASLQRLFLVCYRLWQQNETEGNKATSLPVQHFRRFQQRVRQEGTTLSIARIADELAITPVHLNRICQAIAGQSAS